jgi:hypothetical protein
MVASKNVGCAMPSASMHAGARVVVSSSVRSCKELSREISWQGRLDSRWWFKTKEEWWRKKKDVLFDGHDPRQKLAKMTAENQPRPLLPCRPCLSAAPRPQRDLLASDG